MVSLDEVSEITAYITPILISDNELNPVVRSLNHKYPKRFIIFESYEKRYVKGNTVSNQFDLDPLRIFNQAMLVVAFFDKGNISGID